MSVQFPLRPFYIINYPVFLDPISSRKKKQPKHSKQQQKEETKTQEERSPENIYIFFLFVSLTFRTFIDRFLLSLSKITSCRKHTSGLLPFLPLPLHWPTQTDWLCWIGPSRCAFIAVNLNIPIKWNCVKLNENKVVMDTSFGWQPTPSQPIYVYIFEPLCP